MRLLLFCLLLAGCGAWEQRDCYVYGDFCNAGKDGKPGQDGAPGVAGERGPAGETGATGVPGNTGERGVRGETGTAGERGEKGERGAEGPAGQSGGSCHVLATEEGALIFCDDGSQAVVLHGEDGAPAVVDTIDPCGDLPEFHDEYILVLSDGRHVAFFEDGSRRFLTVLLDGNYRTTDKQKCEFSIEDGEYVE